VAAKIRAAGGTDKDVKSTTRKATNFDEISQSHEYGSYIIHSLETGTPRVVYGNVANNGIIDNLPQGCTVEVPCLVDKNGVQPTKIGMLPPQLAAMMQTNINVQNLTVEAALTGKREHIYHAAMLDPHTGAELDLDQIWSMVDELIAAHGDWLPDFH
jgi:alpha-galactosidase